MNPEVKNIDCMEAMKGFPDKFFDLAICDPPYGIGEHGGKVRHGAQSKEKGFKVRSYDKKGWDFETPSKEYFNELFRISKNQIIWGGNYFIEYLYNTSCFIVWDKKGTDQSDFADCEIAWTSFTSAIRKFKFDWIGFGNLNLPEKRDRFHPTQKPVALYKWLLHNYAKAGDKILDTHLGSGSSRIAAHDMGFQFWGYEIDKDYFDAQEKRFKNHIAQLTLSL